MLQVCVDTLKGPLKRLRNRLREWKQFHKRGTCRFANEGMLLNSRIEARGHNNSIIIGKQSLLVGLVDGAYG